MNNENNQFSNYQPVYANQPYSREGKICNNIII